MCHLQKGLVVAWGRSKSFLSASKSFADSLWLCSLAYSELYILTSVLFRPGGPRMSLFETDVSDVEKVHHFTASLPKMDSKGLRIKVQ